jgi:hypothetical protein
VGENIVWKQSHFVALRYLYLKCYIGSCTIAKETMLKDCFRGSEVVDGKTALNHLQQISFVLPSNKNGKMLISVNKRFLPQIKRIINYTKPATSFIEAQPMDNLIPEGYNRDPLFITEGNRYSKGVKGRYYYYEHKSKVHDIVCIIISGISKQKRYFLGSVHDSRSIVSEVYKVAKRKKKFYKADFNTAIDIPHGIVENRQPIKAAIDILEHLNLVRKTGKLKRGSAEYEVISENVVPTTLSDFSVQTWG